MAQLLAAASLFLLMGARVAAEHCPAKNASTLSRINVHLAPHTHDDLGWVVTYMQYFSGEGSYGGRNVTLILDTVVAGLLADPKRRFAYTEQGFFQLWYERQSAAVQAEVQGLVKSRQLVFLNGGWSMCVVG